MKEETKQEAQKENTVIKEEGNFVEGAKAVATLPFKTIRNIIINYLVVGVVVGVLIFSAINFMPNLLGKIILNFNPVAGQRQAIKDFNNTKDSFSTIEGTKVTDVPLNGIEKMFSFTKKSSSAIMISIPKVLNSSEIFNTNNLRSEQLLKNAWINSINQSQLRGEAKTFKVLYNKSTVLSYNGSSTES